MDYYGILGIARKATPKDIKTAYKKMALLWHPDKTPDSNIDTMFAEISNAYNTLSDPKKRKSYDLDITNLVKPNKNRTKKTTSSSESSKRSSYSYGPTEHRRKEGMAYAAKKGKDNHNDFFNQKPSGSQNPFANQDPYEALFGDNPRYMPTVPLGRNDKQPGRTIPSYAKVINLPSQIDLPPARYGYMPQFDTGTGRGWWKKMTKREYMMEEDEYAWDAFHIENDNRHRLQEEWKKSR